MTKLLIDINVILDVALEREPHWNTSQRILALIEKKKAVGYISALSCATIHYLIQKHIHLKMANEYVRDLLSLVSVVEVDKEALERGLQLNAEDFEDGIQMACAESCKANYIITRDPSDFKRSAVPAVSPVEYLATLIESHA